MEFSTQLAAEQDLNSLTRELVERTCRLMNLDCGTLLLAIHPGEVSAMVVRKAPLVVQTGVLTGEHLQLGGNGASDSVHMTTATLLANSSKVLVRSKETLPIMNIGRYAALSSQATSGATPG